jgi:hypothetical protein
MVGNPSFIGKGRVRRQPAPIGMVPAKYLVRLTTYRDPSPKVCLPKNVCKQMAGTFASPVAIPVQTL